MRHLVSMGPTDPDDEDVVAVTDADRLHDQGSIVFVKANRPLSRDAFRKVIENNPHIHRVEIPSVYGSLALEMGLKAEFCQQQGRVLVHLGDQAFAVVQHRPNPADLTVEYTNIVGARLNSYGELTVEPKTMTDTVRAAMSEAADTMPLDHVHWVLDRIIRAVGGKTLMEGLYWMARKDIGAYLSVIGAFMPIPSVRFYEFRLFGDDESIRTVMDEARRLWDFRRTQIKADHAQALLNIASQMRHYEETLEQALSSVRSDLASVRDGAAEAALLG